MGLVAWGNNRILKKKYNKEWGGGWLKEKVKNKNGLDLYSSLLSSAAQLAIQVDESIKIAAPASTHKGFKGRLAG